MKSKFILSVISIFVPPTGAVFAGSKNLIITIMFLIWLFAIFLFFAVSVLFSVVLYTLLVFCSIAMLYSNRTERKVAKSLLVYSSAFNLSIFLTFCVLLFNHTSTQPTSTVSTSQLMRGKKLFAQCSACHRTTKVNFVGPHLLNIYGREAGSLANYDYSTSLREKKFKWDERTLLIFLNNQTELVPNGKMVISPMPKEDILDIIEYLKTL